jgi:hypothetical protein
LRKYKPVLLQDRHIIGVEQFIHPSIPQGSHWPVV